MDTKRTYTEREQRLIEKYRDANVEFADWHDPSLESFVEVCGEWGMGIEQQDITYTGFWSQGDGASFSGRFGAMEILEGGDKMTAAEGFDPSTLTGVPATLYALYSHLHDAFGPERFIVPEIRAMAEGLVFRVQLGAGYYVHSGSMSVEIEITDAEDEWAARGISQVDPPTDEQHGASVTMRAMCTTVIEKFAKYQPEWGVYDFSEGERDVRDLMRCVADALYSDLNDEYDHLTSDDMVWEAIEANEWDEEDDEEGDDEEAD